MKLCLLLVAILAALPLPGLSGLNQRLLVVSFDGFRQLYFKDRFLPWFSEFRKHGLYSDQVQSIFPSETFPNHFSIVTGMYAESHGIIGNRMYDPFLGETFHKSDNSPKWWASTGAEPIWVTAERQGKRVSVQFWPGSAVLYPPGNFTPSYYRAVYDTSVPLEARIDETIHHLENSDIQLAFIYYHQPDVDGHANGAPSTNVEETLKQTDWYLSYLMKRLNEVNLGKDQFNVVICADHGIFSLKKPNFL